MPKAKQPPANPEQMLAELARILGREEFANLDEAKAYLEQVLTSGITVEETPPSTPLEEAQELIYEAWETESATKRVQLARKALSISPDCADAYILLAEDEAKTPHESLEYHWDAVAAGERALGAEFFVTHAGHFWGMLETRPYMRARFSLAQNLLVLNRRVEAVEHMEDLLRLNPNDNQGIRYVLAGVLLDAGAHDKLKALLDAYDEESAHVCYDRALMLYCQTGPSQEAAEALRKAFAANAYVPDRIIKMMEPELIPEFMEPGSEEEAIDYLGVNAIAWMRTWGAIPWLELVWRQSRSTARPSSRNRRRSKRK